MNSLRDNRWTPLLGERRDSLPGSASGRSDPATRMHRVGPSSSRATEWACLRLRASVPNARYCRIVFNTLSKTTSVMACGAAVLNVSGGGYCATGGVPEASRSADERMPLLGPTPYCRNLQTGSVNSGGLSSDSR